MPVATSHFYVGAYWGSRQESVDDCANRALRLLRGLGALHPAFDTWYRRGSSLPEALQHRVIPEREAISSLLKSGQIRTDIDGFVIEELGYSMNMWTGKEAPAELSIGCGKFIRSEPVKNAVILTLPRSVGDITELSRPTTARAVIQLLVDCWEPDWVTWTSREWRNAQSATQSPPVFGWMTYLSQPFDPAELPSAVTLEQFGSGYLVTAAHEITDVTVATLIAIREAFPDRA
jgi:hypothetical protein